MPSSNAIGKCALIATGIVAVTGCVIGILRLEIFRGNANVEEQLKLARKEGILVSGEAYAATFPKIAFTENAANDYQVAFNRFAARNVDLLPIRLCTNWRALAEDDILLLRPAIASLDDSMDWVRKGNAKTQSLFPRDRVHLCQAMFKDVVDGKKLCRAICVRAIVKSRSNRSLSALDDLLVAAEMTSHMASDESAICVLSRVACEKAILSSLAIVVGVQPFDTVVLSKAQKVIDALGPAATCLQVAKDRTAMTMEQFRTINFFAKPLDNEGYRPLQNALVRNAVLALLLRQDREVYRLASQYPNDPLFVRDEIDEKRREFLANTGFTEKIARGTNLSPLMPELYTTLVSERICRDVMRCLVWDLQASTKRGIHDFSKVIDAAPNRIAHDPYSRGRFQIHRILEGICIYSVGEDRVDDSGHVFATEKSGVTDEGFWIGKDPFEAPYSLSVRQQLATGPFAARYP